MYYNINDILPYLDMLQLDSCSEFEEEYATETIENFLYKYEKEGKSLPMPTFCYDSGCTKLVIMPKGVDYVIKIPFNGHMRTDYDEHTRYFEDFETEDYCALEEEKYFNFCNYCKRIGREEFIDFLLPVVRVVEYEYYPVYIQYYAEPMNQSLARKCSRDSVARVKENKNLPCLPANWLGLCLEKLDNNIKKLEELCDAFDIAYLTGDLHSRNIGYHGDFPVIIDYGGYDECY